MYMCKKKNPVYIRCCRIPARAGLDTLTDANGGCTAHAWSRTALLTQTDRDVHQGTDLPQV